MKYSFLLAAMLMSSASYAQELIVRADIYQPKILPTWSKMPSTSPACNDSSITTKFSSLFGKESLSPALLFQANGKSFLSKPFASDLSISDVHLAADQQVIFALNYRGGTEGVYSFNKNGELSQIVKPSAFPEVQAMSRPSLVNGEILYRALNKNGLHTVYQGSKKLLDEAGDISYLYLPTSKNDQVVLKVGYGTPGKVSQQNPDKIISIFKGVMTTVAVDKDVDTTSKFISFDNSPIPGGDGSVAFIAEHEDSGRSLWLYKNETLKMIFSGEESSSKLEYFSPAVNSNGDVVFRLITDKRRSVAMWSEQLQQMTELMKQGQSVKANEEDIRVIDRERWPAFAGKPCVTENGTVYIHAVLESSASFENRGSGIFKFDAR